MKPLNYLLVTAAITTAVFAADQSIPSSTLMESFTQEPKLKCYVRTYERDASGELTGVAIDTDWPPRDRKINLSELFSSDTGHPDIDQKAFDLTHLLFKDAESIKQFRTLTEDAQITAAVDVSRLATLRVGKEDFKKRCDALLSGSSARLLLADVDYSKFFVPSVEGTPAPATTDTQ